MSRTADKDPERLRAAMIDAIAHTASDSANLTGRAAIAPRVLDAMARVPRHAFAPDLGLRQAYENRPQPIGHGQTISQPFIVALMTDLLALGPNDRVLEIGGGCGYQAAVLAELAGEVHSVELQPELAQLAKKTLWDLGYEAVHVHQGDGLKGLADAAPFDAMLAAACLDGPVPDALVEQLAPGGRMVIPRGPRFGPQLLYVGGKSPDGEFTLNPLLPVAFVPLVSEPD